MKSNPLQHGWMTRIGLPVVLSLLLCAIALCRPEQVFQAKCVGISDGDTITVLRDHTPIKIRLEGIDCPELHQDFGNRARQYTASLVFGKTVTVSGRSFDRYGRMLARVLIDRKDLGLLLVQAGLAWHYRTHSHDKILAAAEQQARAAKRGLWSMKSPMPPWEWRVSRQAPRPRSGRE